MDTGKDVGGAMETYQAYPGQVRGGRPVIAEDIVLPENASIIVTVINAPTTAKAAAEEQDAQAAKDAYKQAHLAALDKFCRAMAEIDDEPLDDEFFAIIAGDVKFRTRELDL
jgi:hypothetical protein